MILHETYFHTLGKERDRERKHVCKTFISVLYLFCRFEMFTFPSKNGLGGNPQKKL